MYVAQAAYAWGIGVGTEIADKVLAGQPVDGVLKLKFTVARWIALNNARKLIGIHRARALFTGAAPISPDLVKWYLALGVPMLEVWGMTETCGAATGVPASRIIWKHLLPNALTPLIIAITFGVPNAIFTEAALSFIGVGISPPVPSWGQMVGEYQQYIRGYWYLATFPAIAIALTMLAFSFLGDGLRDALDPRMKQ